MSPNDVVAEAEAHDVSPGRDDIKLKKCAACFLVRYCSVNNCQKEHMSHHTQACKKRVADLRDEILFTQPDSTHNGDCPICLIPISLDQDQS